MESLFPKLFSIGFTGTQDGMTEIQKEKLKIILRKTLDNYDTFVFHHGDCIGADADAHKIAVEEGGDIIIHPPVNKIKRAFCKPGKVLSEKDYLVRNRDIVDTCNILVGTPKQYQEPRTRRAGGTWYTLRYAKSVRRPHIIIYPDGKWQIMFNFDKLVGKPRSTTDISFGDY